MSIFLQAKGIQQFGASVAGTRYMHLLCEDDANKGINFINPEMFEDTKWRFSQHKAGDERRVYANTCSSQAYCFNLFAYLNRNKPLADLLFSDLLKEPVTVHHIEIEFTPNDIQWNGFPKSGDESIGDQSDKGGTDADVAIFYTKNTGGKGVLLLEFKFIEAEFSVCGSYKSNKEGLRTLCNSNSFFNELIDQKAKSKGRFLCGYNKYENWQLTATSKNIDIEKVQIAESCPFKKGCNQLWRNMLLAAKVAVVRECEDWGFWVLSPKPNDDYLWQDAHGSIEEQFRSVLTPDGNSRFRKVYLEDIFSLLHKCASKADYEWLSQMEEKYLIK